MSGAIETAEGLRRFKRYPEYTQSNVRWIGDIPVDWNSARLKFILARNESGAWGDEGDTDGTIVLRSTDVTLSGDWRLVRPAIRSLSARQKASALLETGDLVVTTSSGSALHLGKTALVSEELASLECCFSNFMQRLRTTIAADPRFVAYLLNSPVGREQMNYLGSTTTGLANLNGHILGSIHAPVPPRCVQQAIANFLDRETAKIDALVAKKKRLIELLNEKRTALITHAVTKGLDPSVPMKPSGIDWLGEIPEHWEPKKLWHLTPDDRQIMYGIVLPGPNVEDGVPIVKGGEVKPGRLALDMLSRTTVEIEAGYARSRLKGGDIVYAIRGSIGAAELVPDEIAGANLTQDAARIAPANGISGRWLLYAVKSEAVFRQLEAGALGATIRGINIRDLKRAWVPVPPPEEQDAIARNLGKRTERIGSLIDAVQSGIERLKEFRIALIAAAVTGKIDVRGEVS